MTYQAISRATIIAINVGAGVYNLWAAQNTGSSARWVMAGVCFWAAVYFKD